MADKHSKIIAAAARAQLGSLGFQRQGRSRLWLADRGHWLNVVEFTPSRWSKSVQLMNAVHWLWAGTGFLSFNEAVPSAKRAEVESEDQFEAAVATIAEEAQVKAAELDQRFSSLDAIGAFVVDRARSSQERMAPSWCGYEAGIACGLLNRFDDAERFLRSVIEDRVSARAHAHALLPLLGDQSAFRNRINEIVAEQRRTLKLAPLIGSAF